MLQRQARELGAFLGRTFRPHGVLGVVQHQQPRPRGDLPLDAVHVEAEIVAPLPIAVGHRPAAMELDLGFVDGVTGIGIQNFVAGVHEGLKELADHRLAPRLDGHILHGVGHAPGRAHVCRQRFAQLRDARGGTVAGLSVPHCLDGCIHHVLGRGDIQVSEVKRIDRVASCRESSSFRGNGERRFGSQA